MGPPMLGRVEAVDLVKQFRTFKRKEGLTGAIRDLFSREYTTLNAVDKVSFQLEPGEMVGCIGPNGAGKSTSVKMLTGILVPTSGQVIANGFETLSSAHGLHGAQSEWSSAKGRSFGGTSPSSNPSGYSSVSTMSATRTTTRACRRFDEILELNRLPASAGAQTQPGRAHAPATWRRLCYITLLCCFLMNRPLASTCWRRKASGVFPRK